MEVKEQKGAQKKARGIWEKGANQDAKEKRFKGREL